MTEGTPIGDSFDELLEHNARQIAERARLAMDGFSMLLRGLLPLWKCLK